MIDDHVVAANGLDYYEMRHTVGFEETNLVGNVYYVNYLRWQGRCRELFLKEEAPAVLAQLQADLKLFTLKVECEFVSEITALDDISVRMRLEELTQTQFQFSFEYVHLLPDGSERQFARGRQRIACMRGPNNATVPTRVPEELRSALAPYDLGRGTPPLPAAVGVAGTADGPALQAAGA